ncbi:MAG: hypothetical protein KTR31_14120 [Myxococcales bacterium]|nr:hypothetical protein [Myxococcales bacterium]
MSFRFAIIIALAGIASGAAFVPWSNVVRIRAVEGLQAEPWLAIAGYLMACLIWVAAGTLATRGAVSRPYLVGPAAGALAAAISAWLVWLPATNVWSLHALWAAVVAETGGPETVHQVVGESTSDLLHFSILGFWAHASVGLVMGLVGAVLSRGRQDPVPADRRRPVLWPLRMWLWTVALALASIVALQQTEFEIIWSKAAGFGPFEPLELLLINGACLGGAVAGPVGATAALYWRSPNVVLRRFGQIVYGGVGLLAFGVWVGAVPLLAPAVVSPLPVYLAYCLVPLTAAIVGVLMVRRDPPPRIPRASDMFAEVSVLLLLTGPLVACGGLGAAAWATLMGPQVWSNVIAGFSEWSNLRVTIAEVLSLQALAWVPMWASAILEGPLVMLPALLFLRWRANKEEPFDEVDQGADDDGDEDEGGDGPSTDEDDMETVRIRTEDATRWVRTASDG